jgi:hypothetical protein
VVDFFSPRPPFPFPVGVVVVVERESVRSFQSLDDKTSMMAETTGRTLLTRHDGCLSLLLKNETDSGIFIL